VGSRGGFSKEPLAAGGTVFSGWTFLNFFSFYVHPVDKNTGQYIRTEGKDKDSWQLAIGSWQARREVEGFPIRLKQRTIYQKISNSKLVTYLVVSGKEAFQMARRACCGCPRRGSRAVGEIKPYP